jgi:hypothetical protein
VRELHGLINLRRTQRVSASQRIKLRASIERCTCDSSVQQPSVKEAVAEFCGNACADTALPA